MPTPDTLTTEELYFEAVHLARRLAEAVHDTHRYTTRHARLSLALDHARDRLRRRYVAAYSHRRRPMPLDLRPTEELP